MSNGIPSHNSRSNLTPRILQLLATTTGLVTSKAVRTTRPAKNFVWCLKNTRTQSSLRRSCHPQCSCKMLVKKACVCSQFTPLSAPVPPFHRFQFLLTHTHHYRYKPLPQPTSMRSPEPLSPRDPLSQCRSHAVRGVCCVALCRPCGAVLPSARCTLQVERGDHVIFYGVVQKVVLRVPSRSLLLSTRTWSVDFSWRFTSLTRPFSMCLIRSNCILLVRRLGWMLMGPCLPT